MARPLAKRATRQPDPDAPEMDREFFARGMPLAQAPAYVRDSIREFQRRYRGQQKTPAAKRLKEKA
jgi:hypothetical protein